MTQPTAGTSAGASATTDPGAGMSAGATIQVERDTIAVAAGAEAEAPWYEDGGDRGRDLGTGAVDAEGNQPEHSVDTPRTYEGPNDPLFPATTEESVKAQKTAPRGISTSGAGNTTGGQQTGGSKPLEGGSA